MRNSLCRWVELSDRHTVVEGEGSFGDYHGTKSELYTHGDMVCKVGERPRAKECGVAPRPRANMLRHRWCYHPE